MQSIIYETSLGDVMWGPDPGHLVISWPPQTRLIWGDLVHPLPFDVVPLCARLGIQFCHGYVLVDVKCAWDLVMPCVSTRFPPNSHAREYITTDSLPLPDSRFGGNGIIMEPSRAFPGVTSHQKAARVWPQNKDVKGGVPKRTRFILSANPERHSPQAGGTACKRPSVLETKCVCVLPMRWIFSLSLSYFVCPVPLKSFFSCYSIYLLPASFGKKARSRASTGAPRGDSLSRNFSILPSSWCIILQF